MRRILVVALCAVYSVQAWIETFGALHIETGIGTVPEKYYPLIGDDLHATRKANAFVNFIKNVPKLNPLKLTSLGPYNIALPDVNFQGDLILTNVEVNGLKSLTMSNLLMRMNPHLARIDFNASLPQVSANVDFMLQGVLSDLPLNVNGQLSANLLDLILSAAIGSKVLQLGSHQVYQLNSADIDIFLFQLQIAMNTDQYSEDVRTLVVQFLRNTDQYASIVDDILRAVLKAIDQELTKVPAKDILQYLLGSARPSSLTG